MAIAAEAGQATDATLGGTDVDTYSYTIKRDRMATTVTVADTALAGMDDPKFTQRMDLGGGTTMHVRAMEADDDGNVVDEVVMVTTDIQAPRGRPFASFENAAGETPQALDVRKDGVASSATNPNDSLNVNTTARSLLMSAMMFSSGSGGGTVNFDGDDADTADMDEADEVMGYYNGAPGTFRCNDAGGCTVTLVDSKVTGSSNDWIFTPAAGATSDQPDYDYLSYGFWLKRTTDSDGVLTYNEVETFATSSVAATGSVASVTGSATYSGGATGVFVHSVSNPDGTEASATSGHFRADAELTATFGQTVDNPATTNVDEAGRIAPNMLNTLTGTINNFQLAGHDEGPGWSVALQGDIDTNDGTAAGTAEGGMGNGVFGATFHGPNEDADNDPIQPSSVVGEFNAGFSNGSVAGAFGARKNP